MLKWKKEVNMNTVIKRLTEELEFAEARLRDAQNKEQADGYSDALISMDRSSAEGYLAGIQQALDILENTTN